uniref:Uncharacterized protein n=1 Tax=Aegilops tauschii subsp. strangulata TaxID=200361 RepID=A0A453QJ71_AEGTS
MNSLRRSSYASPRPPTSRAPPRPASPSAASSPPTPSSAGSAPSTRRPSSASSAAASSPRSRPTLPPQRQPPLPTPTCRAPFSPHPFSPAPSRGPAATTTLATWSRSSPSATPCTVVTSCCRPSPTFWSVRSIGRTSWSASPSSLLLALTTLGLTGRHSESCTWIEFSTVDLPPPPGPDVRKMAIVEAGGGRLGMLTISEHPEPGADHLLYAVQSKDANGTNQWQSKSVISLPENYRYGIMGVAGGYLLLTGYPEDDMPISYFSLNLQTFQVEWFCQTGDKSHFW